MNFIQGWDRQQQHLLPDALEDYVRPDNPVRFLDAFVDSMDLAAAGFRFPKADPQGRGRPAYQPRDLLKLYLYGYLRQIRSSRRLEEQCRLNLEVLWLLRKLGPDFKTIADFRKDNAVAFKAVVREFTALCRELDLFGGELIAIDGTKIKAQNAPGKNFSRTKLEKFLQRIEQRLEEYLKALDEADATEAAPAPVARPNAQALQEKIAKLRERKSVLNERLQGLAASGESQVSLSDPDSRAMGTGARSLVGYNVQAAVDGKHHLIAESAVTQASNDLGQLAPMAAAAKATLELDGADVVADTGYYKSEDIKVCQEMGLEPHVRAGQMSPSERAGRYGKKDFGYEAAGDVYRCPAGAALTRRRRMEKEGKVIFDYDNPRACAGCALKAHCTEAEHRSVSRWEHEASLERMERLLAAEPEKLAARKEVVEHCFGTMKWLLPGGFLVRGQERVGAEVSLVHVAYNLKRALAVVGLEGLMKALKKRGRRGGKQTATVQQPSAKRGAGGGVQTCCVGEKTGGEWSFAV